jgi:copper/silver efflux system protein
MISSTILTLIVIPAVYALIKGWGLQRRPAPALRQVTNHGGS